MGNKVGKRESETVFLGHENKTNGVFSKSRRAIEGF